MGKITSMTQFKDSMFEGQLEVVATLSGSAINASLIELKRRDELAVALRESLRHGVSIDDLSEASGYSPTHIKRLAVAKPTLGELAGIN